MDTHHKQIIEWGASIDSVHIIFEKLQGIEYTDAYGLVKVFIASTPERKTDKYDIGH